MIVALNSPYLGGAERSIIHQIKELDLDKVQILIPELKGVDDTKLRNFIIDYLPSAEISRIAYPRQLFNASRSSSIFLNLFSILFLPLMVLRLKKYLSNQTIWCNGNKIALPFYLCARVFNYRNKFLWHFRDYPSKNRLYVKIWSLFGSENFNFVCIGNSLDVTRAIRNVTNGRVELICLYNPVGEPIISRAIEKIKIIGTASMLAPWKGIHEFVLMAKVYERELKELGIEEVHIYGDQIYKTGGEHNSYINDIKDLIGENDFILLKGNCKPIDIFNAIDILVHPSLTSEPFGRILVEAFAANIPVISTAMGGASEIVLSGESGFVYHKNHIGELFNSIKILISNERLRSDLQAGAMMRLEAIDKEMKQNLKKVMEI